MPKSTVLLSGRAEIQAHANLTDRNASVHFLHNVRQYQMGNDRLDVYFIGHLFI